jgi:alpha-galactosidase
MPWTAIEDVDARRGWYAGVESTANVEVSVEPGDKAAQVTLGLAADQRKNYRTRLMPGETFELPTCFVGAYQGEVDDGCNRLRHWVADHLMPPPRDERFPLLVNNTWGSGMDIDEKLCRRMIDESAELGLEMFHIDAGWYRAVGDWRCDPKKFANGLATIADYAHQKGLKFGLWVAWSHGGDEPAAEDHSILTVRDPAQRNWFTNDYDEKWHAAPFTGAPVCLADSQAQDWCLKELKRIVRECKLDLLEHDQVMVLDSCKRIDHPHSDSPTDISYHAAHGYYRVYDALRKEFPDLLLEDCVNGGHMIDYGVVKRVNYISITDTYDPLSNRRAFYDASYALPPAMCECYVQHMPVKSIGEFRHMLRSGMMGWCTIMLDTSQWSAEQHQVAKRQFEIYRTILRPLILHGDLYHVSDRPDGVQWDGMEYFDPKTGRGVLHAFRGTTDEPRHRFKLKGLDQSRKYALSFEDSGRKRSVLTGAQLGSDGVEVQLSEPTTSELVYILTTTE